MLDLILVTGGAGTLGRAVTPALIDANYEVRLFDLRPADEVPDGAEMVVGDLRVSDDVVAAVRGVTGIIHGAAWHGMHLRDHPRDEFSELNVRGTYHVYEAAAAAGARAVVFSSTMGVYGASGGPMEGEPAARVTEDTPLRPSDMYGLSRSLARTSPRPTSNGRGRRRGFALWDVRAGTVRSRRDTISLLWR